MERKIGAQMYTIRDFTATEEGIKESINKLSGIGYKFGQGSSMGDIAAEKLKEICDEADYKIVSTHDSWSDFENNLDGIIKKSKIIGCDMPGVGGFPIEFLKDTDVLSDFMVKANDVCDRLAAEGLTFTMHNHAYEFMKADGKTFMEHVLDRAGKNFKLMVDVYWLSVAGINPVKFLRKYKDFVCGVHYKDLKVENNGPAITEVGNGNLEWEEIIAVCDEIKPKYIFVEQDTNWETGDPFESLKTSYEFLKQYNYR